MGYRLTVNDGIIQPVRTFLDQLLECRCTPRQGPADPLRIVVHSCLAFETRAYGKKFPHSHHGRVELSGSAENDSWEPGDG